MHVQQFVCRAWIHTGCVNDDVSDFTVFWWRSPGNHIDAFELCLSELSVACTYKVECGKGKDQLLDLFSDIFYIADSNEANS